MLVLIRNKGALIPGKRLPQKSHQWFLCFYLLENGDYEGIFEVQMNVSFLLDQKENYMQARSEGVFVRSQLEYQLRWAGSLSLSMLKHFCRVSRKFNAP